MESWFVLVVSSFLLDIFYFFFHLQSTIGEVAVISDKKVVSKLFINKMRKLLEVTQEAVQEKSRSFNSMQIDNSSVDGSPSLVR